MCDRVTNITYWRREQGFGNLGNRISSIGKDCVCDRRNEGRNWSSSTSISSGRKKEREGNRRRKSIDCITFCFTTTTPTASTSLPLPEPSSSSSFSSSLRSARSSSSLRVATTLNGFRVTLFLRIMAHIDEDSEEAMKQRWEHQAWSRNETGKLDGEKGSSRSSLHGKRARDGLHENDANAK